MNIDIKYLMLFDMGIYLIAGIFIAIKAKKISNHVEELAFNIKWHTIIVCFIFYSFYLIGPYNLPPLYPDKITGIESSEKILSDFQEYNKIITKTSRVLYYSTFILALYFLMMFLHLTKFLNKIREKNEKT